MSLPQPQELPMLPRASRPDLQPWVFLVLTGVGLFLFLLYRLLAPHLNALMLRVGVVVGLVMLLQWWWHRRMWQKTYVIRTTFPFGFTSFTQFVTHKWPLIFGFAFMMQAGIAKAFTWFLIYQILWFPLVAKTYKTSMEEFQKLPDCADLTRRYITWSHKPARHLLPVGVGFILFGYKIIAQTLGASGTYLSLAAFPLLIWIVALDCDSRQRMVQLFLADQAGSSSPGGGVP